MKSNRINAQGILKKYMILLLLVVVIVFFSFSSEYFLTQSNIINVLRQSSVNGICSIGLCLVMLTGGIDLSIGAVLGLSAVTCSSLMVKLGIHPAAAVLVSIVIGTLIGLLNGFLINNIRIPALIATLGTQTSIRGLCFILTGGLPVYGFPKSFGVIGKGYIGFVPVPVIIMIVVFVVAWYALNKTRYGRYLYAVGGNREASRLSGIAVDKVTISTYALCGTLAAIAGVVELSRLSSGQPSAGDGYEMNAITSVVLGGVSVNGGEGKFYGVVAGVFLMSILSNGLVMMNVYEYYQQLIRGLVLILAVGIDSFSKRNKKVIKA